MKKILILGGSNAQTPAIIRAKELGYYTITCDYLPDNPGHAYADQYANISTVDKEAILKFAMDQKIDGIIAYASDPSAPTAAYVNERMNLPGNSAHVTNVFCNKDLFRQFQQEQGFLTPWFCCLTDMDELSHIQKEVPFPCVVKPVDLSGSKGVTVIKRREENLAAAVEQAINMSRCHKAIIEQYIPSPYCQLHGDGIVKNGKLEFLALGDQRFRNSVPIGSSLPSQIDPALMEQVTEVVRNHIKLSGFMCGGINVEVRVSDEKQIYVLEIGPRTGGNYVPQLMKLATGFDEMTASLKLAMGEEYEIRFLNQTNYCFQYIVGSDKAGEFQELFVDDYIAAKVVHTYIHKKKDEFVEEYQNSKGVVGVVLLQFSSKEEMEQDIREIKTHIKVIVKE